VLRQSSLTTTPPISVSRSFCHRSFLLSHFKARAPLSPSPPPLHSNPPPPRGPRALAVLPPRPPCRRDSPCSFSRPTFVESRRSSGPVQILSLPGGDGSFSSGRPAGSAWTEPGESSRGLRARRPRFSLASLLLLILHSLVHSLGLRAASFGGASRGPVVCDGVVAVGVLLRSAMEIRSVITWSGRFFSRLVSVLVVVRALLGAGRGVDLVGAAVFLAPRAFGWLFRAKLASTVCCFVSTLSMRLCGLQLDLVRRGCCLT
jgi:hypothetical protein